MFACLLLRSVFVCPARGLRELSQFPNSDLGGFTARLHRFQCFPAPSRIQQVLDLSRNQLSFLPGDFVSGAQQLRYLDLSQNQRRGELGFGWGSDWEIVG